MAKKIVFECDKCKKELPTHKLVGFNGKVFDANGKSVFSPYKNEPGQPDTVQVCPPCLMVIFGYTEDPSQRMTANQMHDAYGDPGPGEWEPTEANGGRGGPGDR